MFFKNLLLIPKKFIAIVRNKYITLDTHLS